jgi:hypothetical protein
MITVRRCPARPVLGVDAGEHKGVIGLAALAVGGVAGVFRLDVDRARVGLRRGAFGQLDDLLLGGHVAGELADHVGHRHQCAVVVVLHSPIFDGRDRFAVHGAGVVLRPRPRAARRSAVAFWRYFDGYS